MAMGEHSWRYIFRGEQTISFLCFRERLAQVSDDTFHVGGLRPRHYFSIKHITLASAVLLRVRGQFLQRYSQILGHLGDFFYGFEFEQKTNAPKVLKITTFWTGHQVQRKNSKARKTLKKEALDATIDVDTAANEPRKGYEILKNRKKVDQFTMI